MYTLQKLGILRQTDLFDDCRQFSTTMFSVFLSANTCHENFFGAFCSSILPFIGLPWSLLALLVPLVVPFLEVVCMLAWNALSVVTNPKPLDTITDVATAMGTRHLRRCRP